LPLALCSHHGRNEEVINPPRRKIPLALITCALNLYKKMQDTIKTIKKFNGNKTTPTIQIKILKIYRKVLGDIVILAINKFCTFLGRLEHIK
jgi:hypothetical protein